MKRLFKKILQSLLAKMGITISRINKKGEFLSNPFMGYDYAEEGFQVVRIMKDNSMMPVINLFTLFEQAVYCEKKDIQGAFVECGVWKGGAVGVMAKANMMYGNDRRQLHLFDAFDDICAPDTVDGDKAMDDVKKYAGVKKIKSNDEQPAPLKGFYDKMGGHGTINACKTLLEEAIGYPAEYIAYHKGWFQDTLPIKAGSIEKIAILRLDGDWYESIKICLEYLYDKVTEGGIVVIDDYGYYEGCTKAVDEFLDKRNIKTFLSYSNVGCRYFVKTTPKD